MDWMYLVGGGTLGVAITKLLEKLLSRKSDKIDALERIVNIQIKKIEDTEKRLDRSEKRIEKLEGENSKYRKIIRTAINCRIPNGECPVLIKQDQYDKADEASECHGCK